MFHLMQHGRMTLNEYFDKTDDTPEALADRLGISRVSMWRIRNGKANLSLDAVSAIVRETGGKVTADDLRISREAA